MPCSGAARRGGEAINPIAGRIAALQILAMLVYCCGLRLALHPGNRISDHAIAFFFGRLRIPQGVFCLLPFAAMPADALALVILAGLIHASWNIAAKKAGGDVRFAAFSGVVMMLFWAPLGPRRMVACGS